MTVPQDHALPLAFYSIVVKAEAVDRSFPGGRDRFITTYQPAAYNDALFVLSAMGMDTVENTLIRLAEDGVVPGADVAVGDMMQGPLRECPGIIFTCGGDGPDAPWTVQAGETPNLTEPSWTWEPPEQPAEPVAPPPKNPWRMHVPRGAGLIWWTGGDDEEEG